MRIIMCAKCSKPVDTTDISQSDFSGLTRFRVGCHGDFDYCEVSPRNIQSSEIVEMVAFRTPALAAKKNHELGSIAVMPTTSPFAAAGNSVSPPSEMVKDTRG